MTPGRPASRIRAGIALAMLAMPLPALADDGPPALVAAIRGARDRYNAALLARDLPGVRRLLIDEYIGLPGTSGTPVAGGDAMVQRFAVAFSDPAFITYVRSPDEVRIAKTGERAMERGHWLARYRGDKRQPRFAGEYLAVWVPSPQGWRLRSESFVTLIGPPAP